MFSWHNKRSRQIISAIIIAVLILAMVVPLLISVAV